VQSAVHNHRPGRQDGALRLFICMLLMQSFGPLEQTVWGSVRGSASKINEPDEEEFPG
jgi:hypothetical protein